MTALAVGAALCGLAGYRLARLVALDTITDPVRDWVWHRAYEAPIHGPTGLPADVAPMTRSTGWSWVYGLVSCPFCAGFWLTMLVAALWFHDLTARTFTAALAAVGVQAFLSAWEDPR